MCIYSWFFFFQAEDGIRDYKVTGVQTCALTISPPKSLCASGPGSHRSASVSGVACCCSPTMGSLAGTTTTPSAPAGRSAVILIGRAAWRGRGEISVGAGSFKKKKKKIRQDVVIQ